MELYDNYDNAQRRVPLSKGAIDHPKHYNADGRHEAVETFCKLNAYKYHYRAGSKEGEAKEKDLAKAQWYLDYFMKH